MQMRELQAFERFFDEWKVMYKETGGKVEGIIEPSDEQVLPSKQTREVRPITTKIPQDGMFISVGGKPTRKSA